MEPKPEQSSATAMPDEEMDEILSQGLSSFAPYIMNRILRRYNARMDQAVRDKGLNVPRLRVLAALAAEGPQTINDLAIFAISEQSSMSRLLDQMEGEGLVRRQTSESDSRSRIVSLTDFGRTQFERAFPLMRAAEAKMFAGFSAAEKALALELLGRMMRNVREHPV